MKLTILLGLLAIVSCRGEAEPKEESAESKEKREAPVAHYTSSAGPHTSHMLQIPSQGHGGSNAISIGAGYSIGGGKHGGYSGGPSSASYSGGGGKHGGYSGGPSSASYSGGGGKHGGYSGGPSSASYSGGGGKHGGYGGGPSSAGHSGGAASVGYSGGGGGKHGGYSGAYASAGPASYKLQSVKPQFQLPGGQTFSSLEDLMQSLRSSGLHVGEPTHGDASAAPAAIYGIPHGGDSGGGALSSIGGHQFALPQATYGGPKLALSLGSGGHGPSYAVGVQGLGAYASGSHGSLGATGPQLFSPAPAQGYSASHAYAAPAAIAVAHAPAVSYGAPSSGHSFGDSVQSFGGQSLGGAGHSYGGAGHSFGGAGLSFGGQGHSFGGLGSSKGYADLYGGESSGSSFKPSAFLGASLQDAHGDAFSGSVGHGGGVSAESLSGFGGHGSSFGSGKYSGQSYLQPSEGFGSSFGGGHSFGSLQNAFSGSGHSSSPPGTSYGVPSGSYLPGNAHVSSSNNYYKYSPTSYSGPSFGQGSSAYSHGGGSLSSAHGQLGSLSSLGSSHYQQAPPSSSYGAPDSDGEHSQTAYNTIKYSSDLNPKKKV